MKKTGNKNSGKLIGSMLTAGLLMFGTASFAQVTDDQGTSPQQQRENVGNTEYDDDFDRYDMERGEDGLDRAEFDRRMDERGAYEEWDTDRDGTINQQEFDEGVRTRQGQETTGNIEETERTGAIDYGTFQDYDRNRDQQIDEDEFREGTFDTWDRNREGMQDNNGDTGTGTGTGTGTDTGTGTGTDGGTGTDVDTGGGTGTGGGN